MAQEKTLRNQTSLSASVPNPTTSPVTTEQPKVFWVGLIIYLISFFIPAVASTIPNTSSLSGWFCAYYSLFRPLQFLSGSQGTGRHSGPPEMLSLFGSGMINVFFFFALHLILSDRPRPVVLFSLKVLIVMSLPLCWVVFHYEKMYPLWGYFLWIVGMLLVLFKSKSPAHQLHPLQGLK
jgi:hypothetical protein